MRPSSRKNMKESKDDLLSSHSHVCFFWSILSRLSRPASSTCLSVATCLPYLPPTSGFEWASTLVSQSAVEYLIQDVNFFDINCKMEPCTIKISRDTSDVWGPFHTLYRERGTEGLRRHFKKCWVTQGIHSKYWVATKWFRGNRWKPSFG